ncbi:hypothetical protein ABT255_39950 [Streptomyces mirabilis]|uniref:hypothetical protein n=1 Tax=Streptomyces mirabilis TaxID=68239 RepID=UPI00331CAA06
MIRVDRGEGGNSPIRSGTGEVCGLSRVGRTSDDDKTSLFGRDGKPDRSEAAEHDHRPLHMYELDVFARLETKRRQCREAPFPRSVPGSLLRFTGV